MNDINSYRTNYQYIFAEIAFTLVRNPRSLAILGILESIHLNLFKAWLRLSPSLGSDGDF